MNKILYVTSEAAPYAASGGLGDVMGALPIAIKKCSPDTEVGVILPLYSACEKYRKKMKKVIDISFKLSWRDTGASIYSLKNSGVTYYFVENNYYFKRKSLYGDYDDGEKFAFFSMAVVQFMLQSGNVPDILHANDWQSALSVVYLKTEFSSYEAFKDIKTVFTIHNIEYQGKYDPYILGDVFSLDAKYLDIMRFGNSINLLKGALVTSDAITTVSPNYACELRNSFFAFGLENIINMCWGKMSGVINGIDYKYFSPKKGGDIAYPYGVMDVFEGKKKNKAALQEELGLPVATEKPLISMITRLTSGKGVDLVLHILDELLELDVQFVILGTGDKKYEEIFSSICARHPDRARALIRFDRVLSKKIYASSDIFLMPSKSEPCGLAQMIACSYGTIPIVRAVGGLYDSIIPYGAKNSNGFVFNNFNAHELLFKVKDALHLYTDKEKEWCKLVRRAMRSDFSWKNSAEKYLEIYNKLN